MIPHSSDTEGGSNFSAYEASDNQGCSSFVELEEIRDMQEGIFRLTLEE